MQKIYRRNFRLLQKLKGNITVVADGAAFGSQMGRIYRLMRSRSGIRLYLPESFEWIILSSGVLDDNEIKQILEKPRNMAALLETKVKPRLFKREM